MSVLQARGSLAMGAVLKVLIVDDDIRLVEGLTAFLETAGYDVERAWNVGDALMVVKFAHPDVVLLGGRTDGIDSAEVLRRIRSVDAKIPAIVLTTGDEPSTSREPRAAGVYGFRVKPRELYRLDRVVAEALLTSHLRDGRVMES